MIEQGTPEWFAQRCGKATASRIADIIAKTKSGPSASRKNYHAQLVAERLTGTVEQSYTNAAMQWGNDKEPDARAAYAFLHADGFDVVTAEFIQHPSIIMSGASPDGYVGDEGMVEIKCPNTATHIETLLGKNVPSKYVTQMQWQMACTGRAWCDFASFDPRLPDRLSLFVRRVQRDEAMIAELEEEVSLFLVDVAATVRSLEEYAKAA